MDPFITQLIKSSCSRQESDRWNEWDIFGFCRIVKTAVEHSVSSGQTADEFRKALQEIREERGWSHEDFSDITERIDSSMHLIYLYVSAFPYEEIPDDDPFPLPH